MATRERSATDASGSILIVQALPGVLADEPLSRRLSVKAFNHPLGSSPMSFFAAAALLPGLRGVFPKCLNGAPMLIQGAASPVRQQLEPWLQRHHLQPRVVGEFDDGALMKAFGRDGHGVFMSPTVLEQETASQYGVQVIGRTDELNEDFYAISVERRITHPGVAAISNAARDSLFSG